MNPKDHAIKQVETSFNLLASAQEQVEIERDYFSDACRLANNVGVPDRLIAEITGYSRARIQQFRMGDPRKKVAA